MLLFLVDGTPPAAATTKRKPHLYRCKRCRTLYVSDINLQRCYAWHNQAGKDNTDPPAAQLQSPQQSGSHGRLPSRTELLAFWESLNQAGQASALLDLSTPGETVSPLPTCGPPRHQHLCLPPSLCPQAASGTL